ncbi:GAF domain-containing protein [Pantanalinema rosaneae CENA516]|uniref:GAF domain-containing protein n=1 Tax=Pantanalinema rosaneae TaxID=1620701 RepID=UPI003D6F3E7C
MDIPLIEAAKGNILLVDDIPENLHLLTRSLTQQGYQVRGVVSGTMALRAVQIWAPDLILLDIKMPDMSGYEVCQQIKASERSRDIPIIFVSALDEVLDKVQAFAVGGVDYVTKPFQIEEVLARIKTHLALRTAQAQISQLNTHLEQRVQQRTAELEAANQELKREITDRQRAEAQLQQQAEQERLVSAIAQRIRQSLDLDTILDTTVAEVQQLLQVDRALIYRFEPDWSGIVVVEAVSHQHFSILGKEINDHCFAKHYVEGYRQGRVQVLEDIMTADLTPCHTELLASFHIRANLAVPILHEEQLWGLLTVNQCTHPRQWSSLEISLLQQLSTQVAIAIHQSELYQQVQHLNTDLEQQIQERTAQLQQARDFDALLKQITDKVRDSLDESQILQAAVQALALGLDVITCNTALYDLEQHTAIIYHEYTRSNDVPTRQGQVRHMVDFPKLYDQLLANQCFQFCQPDSDRGWVTLLVCPICDNQGVLGDLQLLQPSDVLFSRREIQLVQQVANHCAIAIRQARLYAAAQSQVKALEQLHQLKDDFLSTVSHELRSPVANMKMALQMLELTFEQLQSDPIHNLSESLKHRISQYLQILNNECDREINLVNDLLDLQRLETNTQPLETEAIDLNLWLPILLESFQERALARQQQLNIQLPATLPFIDTNPNALKRVLAELLHNACKYTPPGERIVVDVTMTTLQIQFQITNFGSEIPTSELQHIFEKFYRITQLDRWKQGGTGLGLALVKRLVEHLGGEITVSSGNGNTRFTLFLPRS